jgi:hypothetical protein
VLGKRVLSYCRGLVPDSHSSPCHGRTRHAPWVYLELHQTLMAGSGRRSNLTRERLPRIRGYRQLAGRKEACEKLVNEEFY